MNEFADKTYGEVLRLLADRHGSREALMFRGRRYSFRDLKESADAASARLWSLGLRPGDKVAIWLPNRPEYIFLWLGACQIGLVAVMLNTRLKRDEAAYQLRQSDSRAVIVPGPGGYHDFIGDLAALCPELRRMAPPLACAALPELRHVVSCDPVPDDLPGITDWSVPAPAGLPMPPLETDPDRPALIAYSSGTTALPKGAMITHCLWRKGWDIGTRIDLTPDDCLYLAIPMFGSMATMNGVNQLWVRGGRVVLGEHFEAARCLETLEAERCTVMHLLPPMVHQICEHPDFDRYDIGALRIGFVLSIDRDILALVEDKMGVPGVMTGYGMTETTTVVTRNRWDDPREVRFATQGYPVAGLEIKIADPDTGRTLPQGEAGEIVIRGYCLMAGYYNKPEETRKILTPDGWLRSGDGGMLDGDGRLTFLHRLGDSYKTRGFNVSPAEIETALGEHPAVAAAAVVGLPDRDQGAVGIAFVIPRPDQAIDERAVLDFLRPKLSGYKLPRRIFAVAEFPLTAGTGKVQKFRLREIAAARLAGARHPSRL